MHTQCRGRKPIKYAEMLADKLVKHSATAWLVNTGWVGGQCGKGGSRCPLKYATVLMTRAHLMPSPALCIPHSSGFWVPSFAPALLSFAPALLSFAPALR